MEVYKKTGGLQKLPGGLIDSPITVSLSKGTPRRELKVFF